MFGTSIVPEKKRSETICCKLKLINLEIILLCPSLSMRGQAADENLVIIFKG